MHGGALRSYLSWLADKPSRQLQKANPFISQTDVRAAMDYLEGEMDQWRHISSINPPTYGMPPILKGGLERSISRELSLKVYPAPKPPRGSSIALTMNWPCRGSTIYRFLSGGRSHCMSFRCAQVVFSHDARQNA